jgi:hypothetical protein
VIAIAWHCETGDAMHARAAVMYATLLLLRGEVRRSVVIY